MTGFKNKNKLYFVNLEPLPKLKIDKIWACIFKQSTQADLLTWYCCFGHFNKAFIWQLPSMTKGMEISFHKILKLLFCEPCIINKNTRQPYQESRVCTTCPEYQIHINLGGGGNIFVSGRGYQYFFLAFVR